MSRRRILVTDAGALRAPWRVIFFCVASLAALVIVGVLVGPILAWLLALFGAARVSNDSWIEALALLVSTAFMIRYVERRPWRDVWMDRGAARPTLLLLGFALGTFAIAVPTGLLIVGGWLRNDGSVAGSWWGAMLRVSLTLIPAALFEELLTRGYILSALRDSWGWLWAVVATSVGFGLLHLMNNGATVASVSLVTLAGFFLAAVLYATRSLYAAWAAHFAWNWTMAAVFHVAVSGYPLEAPNYRYVDAGPDWATGGEWGPEGGAPAALGMVGGMAFLFARRRRAQARRVTDLDKPEN